MNKKELVKARAKSTNAGYLDLDTINMEDLENEKLYNRTGLILDEGTTYVTGTLRPNMNLKIYMLSISKIVFDGVTFAGGRIYCDRTVGYIEFHDFKSSKQSYVDISAKKYEFLKTRSEKEEDWNRKYPELGGPVVEKRDYDVIIDARKEKHIDTNLIKDSNLVFNALEVKDYMDNNSIYYFEVTDERSLEDVRNKQKVKTR